MGCAMMTKIAMVRRESIKPNADKNRIMMTNMMRGTVRVMMVKVVHGHSSHHWNTHSTCTAHCIHAPCPFPGRPDPHPSGG